MVKIGIDRHYLMDLPLLWRPIGVLYQ